jgi:putative membrane protein
MPDASTSDGASGAESKPDYGLLSAQYSWMRSELSNVRTLLAWVRTSVSLIGFGFTIYNFYRGFLEDLASPRGADAARNLGLALVGAGTLAMVIAIWNYWSLNRFLEASETALAISPELKRRWIAAYAAAAVILVIGLITFLFMLRVI